MLGSPVCAGGPSIPTVPAASWVCMGGGGTCFWQWLHAAFSIPSKPECHRRHCRDSVRLRAEMGRFRVRGELS